MNSSKGKTPYTNEETETMKNSYNNADIQYIMQGRFIADGVYEYILVDTNLVDDIRLQFTPVQASHYAEHHNIERVSSGTMTIIRSEAWKEDKPWPETK